MGPCPVPLVLLSEPRDTGLRPPRRQVVAFRHSNRHLFVTARDDLASGISPVGYLEAG
jgi:hypothetical protein